MVRVVDKDHVRDQQSLVAIIGRMRYFSTSTSIL